MGGRPTRAWRALITAPEAAPRRWKGTTRDGLHTRARLPLLANMATFENEYHAHRGLSPGAMRRVLEYIDAHWTDMRPLSLVRAMDGDAGHQPDA